MKKYSSYIIAFIFTLIQVSPTFAQNNTHLNSSIIEDYNYGILPKQTSPYTVVSTKDRFADLYTGNNKLVAKYEFSATEDLKKFSPRSLKQILKEMKDSVKNGNHAMTALKKFPSESLMFYFVMGAITTGQLALIYEKNPMAGMDELTNQLSPIGMFSFYTFIYMNGLSHSALNVAFKNGGAKFLIPYLSMSAGFIAQSLTAQLLGSPNLKACALEFVNKGIAINTKVDGAEKNPCEVLYDSEVIKEKIWENAPSLVSMLSAAFVSGIVEKVAYSGIYRISGVNLYLTMASTSFSIFRMSFTLAAPVQMAIMTVIDKYFLHDIIDSFFINSVEASSFHNHNDKIVKLISDSKRTGWRNKELNTEFEKYLSKSVARDFQKFRTSNLKKVLESKNNWERFVQEALANFKLSYEFYQTFTSELNNTSEYSKFELKGPLNGVTAENIRPENRATYISKPLYIENQQVFSLSLKQGELKTLFDTASKDTMLYPQDKKEILNLLQDIMSNNKDQIKLALVNLKKLKETQLKSSLQRKSYYIFQISNITGSAAIENKGETFLRNIVDYSTSKDEYYKLNLPNHVGRFKISHPSEYYLLNMICGASDSKNVLKFLKGFELKFLPPKITQTTSNPEICEGIGELPSHAIYSFSFDHQGERYQNALDFIRKNYNREIVSQNNFPLWWENVVESNLSIAFEKFQILFNQVSLKLYGQLFSKEDKAMAPVSTGIVNNIKQELKLNLLILGEMFKDSYSIDNGSKISVMSKFFNSGKEPEIKISDNFSKNLLLPKGNSIQDTEKVLLLYSLQKYDTFEWDHILSFFPTANADLFVEKAFHHPLQIQVEIFYEFKKLIWMIESIELKEKCNLQGKVVSNCELQASNIPSTKDLDSQFETLTKKLNTFASLLGLSNTPNAAQMAQLSPEGMSFAISAFNNIQSLATDLVLYGNIFSTLSWEKLREVKTETNNALSTGKPLHQKGTNSK